jgi:hypothetical protein
MRPEACAQLSDKRPDALGKNGKSANTEAERLHQRMAGSDKGKNKNEPER